MAELTDAALAAELDRCKAEIDAAYWRFCRSTRAKPPCLAVPDAYRRRAELEQERKRRRSAAAVSPTADELSSAVGGTTTTTRPRPRGKNEASR